MYNFEAMNNQELMGMFSDWYKDIHGIRPRGEYWTREVVIDWCNRESTPEAIARQDAIWAMEDAAMEEYNRDLSREESLLNADTEFKYEIMAEKFGFA